MSKTCCFKYCFSLLLKNTPLLLQLKRLNELEDIVADQDNSIAALREKLTNSRKETQSWKHKYEDGVRNHAGEKERLSFF